MKFIPTWFHGILDYIVGIALFFAPAIFGFSMIGGAAFIVPKVLGIGLILYSIFTRYELGIFKLIPMKVHLRFDLIAALFLALSPWIFGFSKGPVNSWAPHLVVGIVVILVVIFSQSTTYLPERKMQ